ncbi:MAG: hypothetical protein WAT22_17710 [Saprospiraceae bacterium]
MRQNLLFLILISYVFTSCEPKHKQVKSINENFNRYINETFPNVKFKDTAIFLLIPDRYCKACQTQVSSLLRKLEKSDNFYIIASQNNLITDSFEMEVILDKTKKFEKLDLGVNSAAIVFRLNDKIKYISEINDFNLPKIDQNIIIYSKKKNKYENWCA